MSRLQSSADLVEVLPNAVRGGMALRIVTGSGEVVRVAGDDDAASIRASASGLLIEPGEGRVAFQRRLDQSGSVAVMTFDDDQRDCVQPFLESLFDVLDRSQVIEQDMESIQPSSLALLEEVSMYNETLPLLSSGGSEVEIVEMGLSALVRAASLSRALFVRCHQATERCDVLVQVVMNESGRQPERRPFTGDPVFSEAGIVRRAIRGEDGAIHEQVRSGELLGDPDGPESLAQRELIAVPVSYGDQSKRVTLGALLIMDKRANSYSNSRNLGSQETKFAIAMASMLGSVLGARRVAEVDKELRMAEAIQQQILPDRAATVAGFDLAGRCNNCGAVGGDYFDFLPMADGRTLAVVADVSGHNLASGMLMVNARSTLKTLAAAHGQLPRIFDELAAALYGDLTRTELFITAVGAALRPNGREVELANAGHNDSLVYRAATGQVDRIPSGATILGFVADEQHEARSVALRQGDVLLLYTDGVVEATNAVEEMLGEDRLVEVLKRSAKGDATEVLESVFRAVDSFSATTAQSDDVTVVVVKVPSTGGNQP